MCEITTYRCDKRMNPAKKYLIRMDADISRLGQIFIRIQCDYDMRIPTRIRDLYRTEARGAGKNM